MLSDVWFYLFWVAVALCASTGAALFVVLHPATDPADTGNQQREYTSPDYARTAGFAISEHPDTEILIPQRFWLINDNTAEIEYLIVPSGFARLRAAPAGTLDIPDSFLKQTGKIVVKFQRRGKPTNSALLESHYQSEHLQDIGMSRPICCYTSK